MARILYGLCSVGIGHAVRSKVVLDYLKKKHDLFIITSHRAYDYLQPHYKNVHNIEGFELVFKKNSVVNLRTLIKNAQKFTPTTYTRLQAIEEKIRAFNPELVISDWETYSSLVAKDRNIPLLSIDNGHYILYGDYPFPYHHPIHYFKAVFLLKTLMRKAHTYIIMLFPGTRLKPRKNVSGVDPIVRDEIRKATPATKDYILVYQSTKSYDKLLTILKNVNHKFIIYGFEKSGKEANLTFKHFDSGNGFANDLINAKALITNGGFTLISEALYLRKPMFIVPIKKHFEQYLNARYVHDQGYGAMHMDLNKENVEHFIAHLDHYTKRTPQWTNDKLFLTLEKLIRQLTIRNA